MHAHSDLSKLLFDRFYWSTVARSYSSLVYLYSRCSYVVNAKKALIFTRFSLLSLCSYSLADDSSDELRGKSVTVGEGPLAGSLRSKLEALNKASQRQNEPAISPVNGSAINTQTGGVKALKEKHATMFEKVCLLPLAGSCIITIKFMKILRN